MTSKLGTLEFCEAFEKAKLRQVKRKGCDGAKKKQAFELNY